MSRQRYDLLIKPTSFTPVIQDDLHLGDDDNLSLIRKIIELAGTGIEIITSVDRDGNPVAPGTGYVTLGVSVDYINDNEADPVFTASPAFGITGTNITNWNTAYSWGNHATMGYLTSAPSYTFANGLVNSSGTVKLGGTLTETTVIDTGVYDINLISGGSSWLFGAGYAEAYISETTGVLKYGSSLVSVSASTGQSILQAFHATSGGSILSVFADATETRITLSTSNGTVYIPSLQNLASQNRLIGQYSTGGRLGYITLGSGLTLSLGVLSATGGSTPTFQQVLTAGSTMTGDNTVNLGTNDITFSNGEMYLAPGTLTGGYGGNIIMANDRCVYWGGTVGSGPYVAGSASTGDMSISATRIHLFGVSSYADNAAAIAAGLASGAVYRTGDLLKIVH